MTPSGLIKMKEELHHQILTLRSIEAAVNNPRFDVLWDDSTDIQRKQFLSCLSTADKGGAFNWIRNHPSLDIGEKPVADLRQLAYRLNIKNYSRLSKPELIRSIQQYGP